MTGTQRIIIGAATLFAAAFTVSCGPRGTAADNPAADRASAEPFVSAAAESAAFISRVELAAGAAGLPSDLALRLAASARDDRPAFEAELAAALAAESGLTFLVDKSRALPETYEPADLVALDALERRSFAVNRAGHRLRAAAADALERMAAAARAEGIMLTVSSAYRSAAYQKTVYERIVRELGQEGADRESARPGRSQHQLGLAVDFGSISDGFALTAESRWLVANAARFGWSLSFPQGYEAVTGYRWESWHYRFVGEAAARLIDRRFGGIQQYALEFLDRWRETAAGR